MGGTGTEGGPARGSGDAAGDRAGRAGRAADDRPAPALPAQHGPSAPALPGQAPSPREDDAPGTGERADDVDAAGSAGSGARAADPPDDAVSGAARLPEQRRPAGVPPIAIGTADAAPAGLSQRDRAVLDLEKTAWRSRAAKDRAIRDRFDISPTRYYQVLNALLDDPAALAAEAELINRLRRERETRRAARSPRHAGPGTAP